MHFVASEFLESLFTSEDDYANRPVEIAGVDLAEDEPRHIESHDVGGSTVCVQRDEADDWGADGFERLDPCEKCGSLMSWWNALGDRRCMKCDPPTKGLRLLEQAQRIRAVHGRPISPEMAELLATLKQISTT